MNYFDLHSFENFSERDIDIWLNRGLDEVSKKLNLDREQLEQVIIFQEKEVLERAKKQSIDDQSEERQLFRLKIISDYLNEFKDANKTRKATIVLGQIASGKSSYCQNLSANSNAMIVDVDFIKQGYNSIYGLRDDFDEGKGTDYIHEEASMLTKKVMAIAASEGFDLVIPKTAEKKESITRIVKLLREHDYDITMVYIDLPIEKCVARNFYRFAYEMENGIPSRLISLETIRKINDSPFRTFAEFLIDNMGVKNFVAYRNDGDGSPMKEIPLKDILEYYNKNSLGQ